MRYSASSIPSLKDRTFFFDANSLIYIFWPTSPDSQAATDYGSILATLIKNNAILAVNEIVISEIINRILRIEFNKTKLPKDKFKEYRDSTEGQSVQQDIDVATLLDVSAIDFYDKIIELLCKKKNMILLTHDYDFSSSSVDILSSNKNFKTR